MASECRGQHFQPLRCSAEMQFFGRRHEAPQLMKIHRFSPGSDYIIFLYKREPIELEPRRSQGGLQRVRRRGNQKQDKSGEEPIE
jgi:hypothetical protein